MELQAGFTREVMEALAAPFPDDEVEFLPRAQSGGMALGLPYIDARDVMRRLDAVVGPANWTFDFEPLSSDGKMVKGRLTVLGVTKCDAGEAASEDELLKSAVSDALKRCAVHFGVGRYLYYLPRIWAPYDNQKRRFIEQPRLDPAAVQRALAVCGVSYQPAPSAGRGLRPAAPAPSREAQPENGGEKRSIWSAGANARSEGRPAAAPPESAGDRAAARAAAAPRETAPAAATAATAAAAAPVPSSAPAGGTPISLVCSTVDCGRALTKGQHDVSVRAYGQPLCPACQKQHSRAGA